MVIYLRINHYLLDFMLITYYITHMNYRHNNTQNNDGFDLYNFFKNPSSPRQKQYEAIRAIVIDNMPVERITLQFGYQPNTLYALLRDAKAGKLELFPKVSKGPKQRRTPPDLQDKIIQYRKKRLSSPQIHKNLEKEDIKLSLRTIERILNDAGFRKMKRRSNAELGITMKGKMIPERSESLDFSRLEPFNIDCPVAGVYFFIPYIIESGIIDIVQKCRLPESSVINAQSAALSMLLLKLIGNQRLSHMDSYDQEPGLGTFSGLNVLPKTSYMCSYSCRTSEDMLLRFQREVLEQFGKVYPEFYRGDFINLDFHSIPHFGDESEMEKVWCGARGKAMKGANTVFAHDGENNVILYTRADILRREEAKEIKRFVDYWKGIQGKVDETLVFDCKFTQYKVLDELTDNGIHFITLRKRSQSLLEETSRIPKEAWKKVKIAVPKRKHQTVSVYESEVKLKDCRNSFRQIIIKDHGRQNPTFVITNNKNLPLLKVLEVYAKRWGVENKLAELVSFFNLNALSSPLMIRIHFDILWTMIADTLYRRFAQDLRRFEYHQAPTIFKRFVNMPGKVLYNGNKFQIKIRKRGYTPILLGVEKLNSSCAVPWLGNRTIEIVWTA